MLKTMTSTDKDDFYRLMEALEHDGFTTISINVVSAYGETKYIGTLYKSTRKERQK